MISSDLETANMKAVKIKEAFLQDSKTRFFTRSFKKVVIYIIQAIFKRVAFQNGDDYRFLLIQ